jgi:FATC domain
VITVYAAADSRGQAAKCMCTMCQLLMRCAHVTHIHAHYIHGMTQREHTVLTVLCMYVSCACADLEDVEVVNTDSATDEQHMQESRRKLDNTKLKFYGANPTVIFEDDLRNNAWVKNLKSSDDWIRVVRGSVDAGNVRAKPEHIAAAASSSSSDSSSRRASSSSSKGSGGAPVQLSVAAQVDCLIDLATDPNVMGRAFHGLSLWI